jgi:hypothetical protein
MFIITQSTQSWYRHHMFACTTCFGLFWPSSDTESFYSHRSFYLLYFPTLASVYTLEVHCAGMLFLQGPYVMKCIKYSVKIYGNWVVAVFILGSCICIKFYFDSY